VKVPQTDPGAGYLERKLEIDTAIQHVLASGRYILGPEVESFEREFADFVGTAHAIGVANGTDAIELALRAVGVGPGDVVFTVSHTAVATVAAIELAGAIPVLVDIDPISFTMDPAALEAAIDTAISGKPKAIIPVHLYGHPADLKAIQSIAKRHNLYLVEDCAQSHGATLDGRATGSWGDIAAFSFYPTKNLGTIGDGGMVVTDNTALAEQVRLLQQYGWKERYISEVPGLNSRLDELHAAILRVKLRHLASDNLRRRSVAKQYESSLSESAVTLPRERDGASHVYHQYVVRLTERDALRDHLASNGIGTLIHYAVPVHLQPAYRNRLGDSRGLGETEKAVRQILSLPMFPQLSEEQISHVCASVNRFCGKRPNTN
jgi:dTDP-4-amino-4,6-dideoxygalactose transaminase